MTISRAKMKTLPAELLTERGRCHHNPSSSVAPTSSSLLLEAQLPSVSLTHLTTGCTHIHIRNLERFWLRYSWQQFLQMRAIKIPICHHPTITVRYNQSADVELVCVCLCAWCVCVCVWKGKEGILITPGDQCVCTLLLWTSACWAALS